MQYRRAQLPGSTYFFTVVTHNRRVIKQHFFVINAIIILPNHLHFFDYLVGME